MTATAPGSWSRRGFVTAAALALAGCAVSPGGPSTPRKPTRGPADGVGRGPGPATSSPSRPPVVVDVPAYVLLPGEVEPACKQAAVTAVTAALTWRDAGAGAPAALARLAAVGSPAEAAATLDPLLGPAAWSSLEVTYPQYGGLAADLSAASVMMTATQLVGTSRDLARRSLTLDVRLARGDAGWQAQQVLLAPDPAAADALTPSATGLLGTDRVVLPRAARLDVEAGLVDDAVLDALVQLSQQWRLDVQVLSTGHPFTVFGTERQSNHSRGRAVDIWAIDGIPVIDQTRCPWRALMEAAAALGADEVGGPVDLDGVRGHRPFFSDHVHQDHVHLGFEPA